MSGPPDGPGDAAGLAREDDVVPANPTAAAGNAIHTFLIADIRGYSTFTDTYGDELAAKLASVFATTVERIVPAYGGYLLELRGDEALVIFTSARQALRSAIALQESFRRDGQLPSGSGLPVGIGLDVGEAVAIRGGYRGAALNVAARLCSHAGAGQVLATPEVVHLATRVEGIRFRPHGTVELKGLPSPVQIVAVEPAGPGEPTWVDRVPPPTNPRLRVQRSVRSSATTILALVVGVACLAVVAFLLSQIGSDSPQVATAYSTARLDKHVSSPADARAMADWLLTHPEQTVYVDVTIDDGLVDRPRQYTTPSVRPDVSLGVDARICAILQSRVTTVCTGPRYPGEGYFILSIPDGARHNLVTWMHSTIELRGFLRPIEVNYEMGQYTLTLEWRKGGVIPPS